MHRETARALAGVENTSGKTVVITGAMSYTGKYATRLLLSRGYGIRTLTNHPERVNPFGDKVQVFPSTSAIPSNSPKLSLAHQR